MFWFVFALLSGAKELGGGAKGVLLNSPNALPWLLLLALVYLAWKKELIGGILICLMGFLTIFFFNAFKHSFVLWVICLPLILLGLLLVAAWHLDKNKD